MEHSDFLGTRTIPHNESMDIFISSLSTDEVEADRGGFPDRGGIDETPSCFW